MSESSSIDALSSILNRIDAHKHKIPKLSQINPVLASSALPKPASSSSTATKPTEAGGKADDSAASVPPVEELLRKNVWYEYIDVTSKKPYYHCPETNETTWTAPESYIPHSSFPRQQQQAAQLDAEEGTYRAFFNPKHGRLSMQSHWEQRGIPQDRAARQLAAFVDLEELERNRQEAKQMRQAVAQSRTGKQWAEYNAQKKAEKKRRRDAWVTED
eukprot:gene33353-40344_t